MKNQTYQRAIVQLSGLDNYSKIQAIKHALANASGVNYVWTKEIKTLFISLMYYFHGNESELDLNKGICLVGKYGVGKSTIMNIFHSYLKTHFPFNKNMYVISSIEEIIDDIKKDGYVNRLYCYNMKENVRSVGFREPKHILINEFGHNYKIKSYGTDVKELFEAFMMVRYDIFQKYRKVTHITTNYGTKELEQKFHPKLVDRFKEMFNIIELKGESFRK